MAPLCEKNRVNLPHNLFRKKQNFLRCTIQSSILKHLKLLFNNEQDSQSNQIRSETCSRNAKCTITLYILLLIYMEYLHFRPYIRNRYMARLY